MRKAIIVMALAGVASQLAVPAFATPDPLNFAAGPQGWRRQGDAAVMAYIRIPVGTTKKNAASMPRAGFKLVAPRPYGRDEIASHINNPTMVDFGVTGRGFNSPWTATLNVGSTVTWASNPAALPKDSRQLNLFDGSGASWVAVGALTVAAGLGIFAIIDQ
jgi:hypothetical protein